MRGARLREPADVLHAPGQRVALALELREPEQARSAVVRRVDPRRVGRDVRERRGDDLRELALQARDLRAQRAACGALVRRLDWRWRATGGQLLETGHSDSS